MADVKKASFRSRWVSGYIYSTFLSWGIFVFIIGIPAIFSILGLRKSVEFPEVGIWLFWGLMVQFFMAPLMAVVVAINLGKKGRDSVSDGFDEILTEIEKSIDSDE